MRLWTLLNTTSLSDSKKKIVHISLKSGWDFFKTLETSFTSRSPIFETQFARCQFVKKLIKSRYIKYSEPTKNKNSTMRLQLNRFPRYRGNCDFINMHFIVFRSPYVTPSRPKRNISFINILLYKSLMCKISHFRRHPLGFPDDR